MNDRTVCTECGTENEPAYEFCKNCGAPLPKTQAEPQTPPFYASAAGPQGYSSSYTPPTYSAYTSQDGIPAEDLAIFIGKKANDFLPKFMKMELSGSKVSWCWPVAILSWFFGPIGAGLWFIYRKMYKPAVLLLSVGLVLDVVYSAFTQTIVIDIGNLSADTFPSLSQLYNTVFGGLNPVFFIFTYINKFIYLVTCALTGMFSAYFYKKHCVSKIQSYRQSGIDMRFYKLGLASVGGTSAGFAVLAIASVLIVRSVVSFLIQILT